MQNIYGRGVDYGRFTTIFGAGRRMEPDAFIV